MFTQFLPPALEAVAQNKPWPRHKEMLEMPSSQQSAGKYRSERSTDQFLPVRSGLCVGHERILKQSSIVRKLRHEKLRGILLFPVLHILLLRMRH